MKDFTDDFLMINMDNEWTTGVATEGAGFRYSVAKNGMLWACGWLRCDSELEARETAWDVGRHLEEVAS